MSAGAVPDWVAPEGKKRDDLKLGELVRFTAVLKDNGHGVDLAWQGDRARRRDWRGWLRHTNHIGQGIIVGLRFVYSGRVEIQTVGYGSVAVMTEPPDEMTVRTRERTHRAYLVCLNILHKPVHVLSDDVVLLEMERLPRSTP